MQDGIQDSGRSPRQLARERLSSPEASHYSMETHQRIKSPGQRRNEHDAVHVSKRYSRSSSPGHSQEKRHGRVGQGYHEKDQAAASERSSYSERYTSIALLKQRRGVGGTPLSKP